MIGLNPLLHAIRTGSPIYRADLKQGKVAEIPFSPQPIQIRDKTNEFQISLSRLRRKGIKIFLEPSLSLRSRPGLNDAAKKLGLKIELEENLTLSTNVLMDQLDDVLGYADRLIEQLKFWED
jgi:hypothetical protein